MVGIGGTGVVTVSQILGTAAMLAGRDVRGLDQTGLSQKAGPVVSDVRITTNGVVASNHANLAGVDCLLAFDLLVAASDTNLADARADRTVVVASSAVVPTGQMVTHPDLAAPSTATLLDRVNTESRVSDNRHLDAAALADAVLGSTTAANVIVLGAAVQTGAMPVPPETIEHAIALNGVAVDTNLAAFRWGRAWADDPEAVERTAGLSHALRPETVDELIDRLADDLVGYQSAAYADRFRAVVAEAGAPSRAPRRTRPASPRPSPATSTS